MLTLKASNFRPAHKTRFILTPARKTCYLWSSDYNQVNFYSLHKTKLNWIPTLKPSQFRSPLYKQANLACPPTRKPCNCDLYTKTKSTPTPHTEITSIATTHTTTKSISMPTVKPCHSRAVLLCV